MSCSMRDTSIAAYNQIKEEGLLSKRRLEVYSVLFHNGPLTCGEVWRDHFKIRGVSQNSINPRLSELRNAGVLIETGERSCRVTGKTCITWDVTSKLPVETVKKKEKSVKVTREMVVYAYNTAFGHDDIPDTNHFMKRIIKELGL